MKQNVFADIDDALDSENGPEAVAIVAVFLFFLWAWIHFETFVGALLLSAVAGGVVGGLAVLFLGIVSAIFARRSVR
jgi:hypothetical protein